MIRKVKVVNKRRLRPWVKITLFFMKKGFTLFLIILGIISLFNMIFGSKENTCNSTIAEPVIAKEIVNEEVKESQELLNKVEANNETEETQTVETVKEVESERYRMTYYYPGDDTNSGSTTASGKSARDFKTNENGWYTYNGKLVVATASKRLLSWDQYKNSTQPTYNLYDELILTIKGKEYEAIVLDVCGACMRDTKIDLFVKDNASGLDTSIDVRRK